MSASVLQSNGTAADRQQDALIVCEFHGFVTLSTPYASSFLMSEPKPTAEKDEAKTNEGYDEAARGGKGMLPSDVGIPIDEADRRAQSGDQFDRAAAEAANDVRRREHSAD